MTDAVETEKDEGKIVAQLLGLMRKIDVSTVVFVLSAAVFVFGYGVATQRYKLFPYGIIEQAAAGWKALEAREDATLMPAAEFAADGAPRPVIKTLSPLAGKEYILMTGGAGQFIEQCPKHGCIAWMIDRDGKVVHSWEVDFKELTKDLTGFYEGFAPGEAYNNIYPVGLALDPDGSLTVTFHGRNMFPYQVGIAHISRDGEILWTHFSHSHHWPARGPDGRIYTPYAEVVEGAQYFGSSAVAVKCPSGALYAEGVRVIAPDGSKVRDISMIDVFEKSGYPGLLYSKQDGCDPLHVNSVDVATAEVASHLKDVNEGDLLVSVREASAIVLIDAKTDLIKRIVVGRSAAQHSAVFAPDGTVYAFDNQGGDRAQGGTRIVHINLDTGAAETAFPKPGVKLERPLFAEERGRIRVSPDGARGLVSTGLDGHIIEFDMKTGEPLWTLDKTFDIGPYLDAHKIKSKVRNARFISYGAYYVKDPGFL